MTSILDEINKEQEGVEYFEWKMSEAIRDTKEYDDYDYQFYKRRRAYHLGKVEALHDVLVLLGFKVSTIPTDRYWDYEKQDEHRRWVAHN